MHISLDIVLKVAQLIATVGVAVAASRISFNQLKISREKLRLDLYNRRFEVYLRTFDYYQEVLGPQDIEERSPVQKLFVKAVRESRFLFPKDAEILQFLEEFKTRASRIVNFNDNYKKMEGLDAERKSLADEYGIDRKWIFDSIRKVEDKMDPYLSFEVL